MPRHTLAEESGVTPLVAGWWAGWRDPQVLLAVALAVPVWAVLAAGAVPHLRVPPGAWAWVSLVLVQPLAEELAFRGVLQGQLMRRWPGRRAGPLSWANGVTTLAFALAHLWSQTPAWAAAAVLPSLVFGHLRERHRSVWPAVAVHAVYNAGFGLAAWWAHG